jgi:hypothetical protein
MNTSIKLLTLLFLVFILASPVSLAQKKKDLIGTWKAYAPDAPGTQNYITKFTKDSVLTAPEGESFGELNSTYKLEKDTLKYDIQGVYIIAKFESKMKMTGQATWAGGESKVIFTKITGKKSKNKNQK